MTQLCPRCGTPVRPRLRRCGVCGDGPAPTSRADAGAPVAATAGQASQWALAAGIFVTVFVLITLLGAALLLGGDGGGAGDSAAPAVAPSEAPSPSGAGESAAVAEPTAEPTLPSEAPATDAASATAGPFDPATLPAGLFCRDLLAQGLPYGDAVAYWDYEGRPERMDADGNDIPCETVYPQPEIDAYWQ